MTLQKTKLSYVILYGLAPFFQEELNDEIKNSECIVIGFDES